MEQTSTTTRVTETEVRAQKRTAIGLAPQRATAPEAVSRPPDESSSGCAHWLLVACVGLLGLAILLLLVTRFVNPTATVGALLGVPGGTTTATLAGAGTAGEIAGDAADTVAGNVAAGVAAGAAAGANLRATAAAYLAQLPGFELWLTDDFSAPSRVVGAQSVPGRVEAAVATDLGVYRMQVAPNQLGWTLFDLAGVNHYHLETSATVDAATPSGAAGVIARFGGPGNFYLFTVDGAGGAKVALWSGGQEMILQSAPAMINRAGQANRLAVEDDGARVRFYVNQVLVSEIVDPQLLPGRPGIATVAAGDAPATVDFDWIAIYRRTP